MKNMKYKSQGKQLSFNLFESSLTELPNTNRWVQLGESLPWDKIEKIYNAKLNNCHGGAGNKPVRIIIGALLIKHKMGLSDEETEQQTKEYQQLMAKIDIAKSQNGVTTIWMNDTHFRTFFRELWNKLQKVLGLNIGKGFHL